MIGDDGEANVMFGVQPRLSDTCKVVVDTNECGTQFLITSIRL